MNQTKMSSIRIWTRSPEILEICRRNTLLLIEDAAWGCEGVLQCKPLETWEVCGNLYFDFPKTMATGEGSMLIFCDETFYHRAIALHDQGHINNLTVPRWEDVRSSGSSTTA